MFAVRSIPTCVLLVNGQPVAGYMGALPVGQVRAFLEAHLPDEAEELRRTAADIADPLQRAEMLRQAEQLSGGRREIVLDLCAALLDANLVDYAAAGLDSVELRQRDENWLKLKARLDLARGAGEVDEAALRERIAADPQDFDARLALAGALAQQNAWPEAFDALLEVVLRDKAEARATARARLVEWFSLCPDMRAVMNARRQLSMYLN